MNTDLSQCIETRNKAIMNLVVEHVNSSRLLKAIIAPINHVRLHKKIVLPYELLGLMGDKKMKCFMDRLEQSSLN